MLHADGRTDGRTDMTKLIPSFRSFAETSKHTLFFTALGCAVWCSRKDTTLNPFYVGHIRFPSWPPNLHSWSSYGNHLTFLKSSNNNTASYYTSYKSPIQGRDHILIKQVHMSLHKE